MKLLPIGMETTARSRDFTLRTLDGLPLMPLRQMVRHRILAPVFAGSSPAGVVSYYEKKYIISRSKSRNYEL